MGVGLGQWPQWTQWASLLTFSISLTTSAQSPDIPMDPELQMELCRNFTVGHIDTQTFFSPAFPRNYPRGIKCSKTISAEYGHFVRVDFRDYFLIEPPSNEGTCDYDYLEIRDGDQGYSPLIGKYCGSDFPPIITSSGRSLWLRFVSDGTIEYRGFKAVYSFIPNPLESIPLIEKCQFEVTGSMEYIGSENISSEHVDYARTYGEPLDCTWAIRADKDKNISIVFSKYELEEPNDCNYNYIQIFDGKTDIEGQKKKFCGSVAESFVSATNIIYVRYFADEQGIESYFAAYFTVFRKKEEDSEECEKGEYDCDDTYCIEESLRCNSIRNCKFGWDEENCSQFGGGIPLDLTKFENLVIVIALLLILIGMCSGMIYNLVRKLSEDKEDVIASREKSLASLAASAQSLERPPTSRSRLTLEDDENRNGCYVPEPPGGGYPFKSKK